MLERRVVLIVPLHFEGSGRDKLELYSPGTFREKGSFQQFFLCQCFTAYICNLCRQVHVFKTNTFSLGKEGCVNHLTRRNICERLQYPYGVIFLAVQILAIRL